MIRSILRRFGKNSIICVDLYLHLQNAHILKINQNILYCELINEKGRPAM
jgi:hypothetical protein